MREVLLQIARCQNFENFNQLQDDHPCRPVIAHQANHLAPAIDAFHVPEPWRGDILHAPLLFISSNPGFNPLDDCPKSSASDDEIVNYYHRGFPDIFPHIYQSDGKINRRKWVRFWASIRARAAELYGITSNEIRPGLDFAITEIVHCKSGKENGVKHARTACTERHLNAVLEASGAHLIVVIGTHAKDVFNSQFKLRHDQPSSIASLKNKKIIWLPHPAGFGASTVPDHYTSDVITEINHILNEHRPPNNATHPLQTSPVTP